MINLKNIHSITDFQRNPKGILGQIKESKSPVVLTVNGRAELVVQDAESYQALMDCVEQAANIQAVREGLDQARSGKGRPAAEFFAEFEREHGL